MRCGGIRAGVWIAISKSGGDTQAPSRLPPRYPQRLISTLPQEKWALQGEILLHHHYWRSLWLDWERLGEESEMDERSHCQMGFRRWFPSFGPSLRSRRSLQPSSLMTNGCCTDFTARAASSDTSEPSETAAPTLPSFKSKESAQKKRPNSTLERFAVPLRPQSADPHLPCVISV